MKKDHLSGVSIAIVVLLFCVGTGSALAQSGDSLYKRLGGYDALAAVTDDFIGRLITDKKLGRNVRMPGNQAAHRCDNRIPRGRNAEQNLIARIV